jgi:hypothetical protein
LKTNFLPLIDVSLLEFEMDNNGRLNRCMTCFSGDMIS